MLQDSKHPVKINTAFRCKNCKKNINQADKTCRNHCKYCLYSLHVDENVPGDRRSQCHGLMEPTSIDYNPKKGYQIIHQCLKCAVKKINKTADDDNIELIIEIMRRQNLQNPIPKKKK
jgi:DNA-directed RNA polymerase subunit RPC12/RpoP